MGGTILPKNDFVRGNSFYPLCTVMTWFSQLYPYCIMHCTNLKFFRKMHMYIPTKNYWNVVWLGTVRKPDGPKFCWDRVWMMETALFTICFFIALRLFWFAFSFWCCVVGFVFVFCFRFLRGDCKSIFVQALLRTDLPSDMPCHGRSIHTIVEMLNRQRSIATSGCHQPIWCKKNCMKMIWVLDPTFSAVSFFFWKVCMENCPPNQSAASQQ